MSTADHLVIADSQQWPRVETGPVSLHAPHGSPRQIDGAHGHLWQWAGDGAPLLALTVGVRRSRAATPRGVEGHLGWQVEQVLAGLDEPTRAAVDRALLVHVEGARAVHGAVVCGARDGLAVRDVLVVSTEGVHLHAVRIGVVDTPDGQDAVRTVIGDLEVHPWEPPR